MSYKITLDSFQGPLDLLLHLIEKNRVDIYDIPISKITTQYMEYIEQWKALNLDIASEFLVMAATLLEIKSKVLLPKNQETEKQLMMEEADPRQELVEKLLEYKKYKKISLFFKDREQNEEKVVYKDPEYFPKLDEFKPKIDIEADMLYKAFKKVLLKRSEISRRKKTFHEIERDVYTIEEKMDELLYTVNNFHSVKFSSLFTTCHSRNEIITIFLAILELIKLKKVTVNQKHLFEDFYITEVRED